MSTLEIILTVTTIGLAVALALTLHWACACHNRSYQRGISYRLVEERCRAIVAAATGAWPHMEAFLGQEFINELGAKLKEMREAERMLSSEYMENISMMSEFSPVEVVRYLMARNTELARVEEAITNWETRQSVSPRVITIANRVIEALAVTERLEGLQSAGMKAANERMQREFKAVIGVCANYAPNMTFADSLPHYVEACLDFTRQKAHETGMAVAYASVKS